MNLKIVQISPAPEDLVAIFEGMEDYEYKDVVCLALVEWNSDGEWGEIISPCVLGGNGAASVRCCAGNRRFIGIKWKGK